jgi:hypothetical protein
MRSLFLASFAAISLHAQDSDDMKKSQMAAISEGNAKSIMMIDPKDRAGDFIKAFDTLRKEIAPTKIYFHIAKGSPITGIMDVSLMDNGTLMIFRVSTPQGPQYKIVPVEDVLDVTHSN